VTAPRTQKKYTVFTKAKWSDPWDEEPNIFCDRFSEVAAPDVSEATLHYNYGRAEAANATGYETRQRKESWGGRYVKIRLEQGTDGDGDPTYRNWIGVIVAPADARAGTFTLDIDGDNEQIETGTQVFHCRGLEFLLERTIVDTSVVETKSGGEQRVNRAIAFNFGQGRDADHIRFGNRGKMGERDAHIFPFQLNDTSTADGTAAAGGASSTAEWTVSDIVTNLLHYQQPTNAEGHDLLDWQAPNTDDAKILDALEPTAHVHGKNLRAIFNGLIDRRRLVGWKVTVDVSAEEGERPRIDVFTFNADELTLPSGKTIPPNGDKITWDFDTDVNVVGAPQLLDDDATRYDQVIGRGHPLGACFSIGDGRGHTVVADWSLDLQNNYISAGASSDAYASATDDYSKYIIIEDARRDPKYHKVFRYFRLSDQFAGTIGSTVVCPDPDEPDLPTAFWFPGLKFLDKTPLLTEHDYETVDPEDIVDHTIASSFPEYLSPFAVIDSGSGKFVALEATGRRRDLTTLQLLAGGESWSASLKMQDHAPGFIVTTNAPQHVIASQEFTPVNSIDAARWPPELDWHTIVCTVFCEFDQQAEAKYPTDVSGVTADFLRRLVINVPNARLDYLAPNTVIGINPDGTLKTSSGGYVRDDTKLLKDVAHSAFAWYGQTRRALTVTRRDLVTDKQIGQLITTIGAAGVQINSVITKIEFDLVQGTTTVHTQFGQFDPQNLGP
jgi:hypothetical protein